MYMLTTVKCMYTCTYVPPTGLTITATVTGGGGSFEVGESTSLSCDVTGAENLAGPTLTYMWLRDGETLTGQEDSMLTDLTTSDSGSYTCVVTVSDDLLITPITSTSAPVTITVRREYSFQ